MNRIPISLFFCFIFQVINAQSHFSGVFQATEAEMIHSGALTWESFLSKNDSLNQNGYRLHDLETSKEEEKRYFLGIWIKSVHPSVVESVHGWANFVKKKRAMAAEGYLLSEVEGYSVSNEEHHFLGVWLKDDKTHKVWKLDSREGVIKKTEEMARQDFFLMDVEAFPAPNKTLTFLALYHKGNVTTPRNYVYTSSDIKAFKTSVLQRQKSGFRMVDFEQFDEKGIPWYLGVFEKGDYKTVLLNAQERSDFYERWDILAEQGVELVDIEPEN